jgi:hypothetical protein
MQDNKVKTKTIHLEYMVNVGGLKWCRSEDVEGRGGRGGAWGLLSYLRGPLIYEAITSFHSVAGTLFSVLWF